MQPTAFIVYTYETGATPPCHAYGPFDQESDADALAEKLKGTGPSMTTMVLPLEVPPVTA